MAAASAPSGSASSLWIDTHAHLQSDSFAADCPAVIERARAAGLGRIILPGSDLDDSRAAVQLASTDALLLAAVGVHPHEASSFDAATAVALAGLVRQHRHGQHRSGTNRSGAVTATAENPDGTGHPDSIGHPDGIGHPDFTGQDHAGTVVAIGEIGLDYHYDFSPRPVQQAVFRAQLDLAWELDMPVIIHEREATADCLAILRLMIAARRLRAVPGVFHCFSGSVETARILLAEGFYLGFDGPITYKNARKAQEVIAMCPRDRLLLETDSPYLTPVPHRGQRNEPAFLPLIGQQVAQIWDCSVVEVAAQTTANARRLFDLA